MSEGRGVARLVFRSATDRDVEQVLHELLDATGYERHRAEPVSYATLSDNAGKRGPPGKIVPVIDRLCAPDQGSSAWQAAGPRRAC